MLQLLSLLAGIGLFLFAMYLIETALKNLSGRKFKLFLQKMTRNHVSAAIGGAIITALLQSSSMVSMMVLAFVGAGVLNMRSALAVILGANLGTTLDSWVVATLGFKMDIEAISYPIVFIGGLMLVLFEKNEKFKYSAFFMLGFGLLFIGLSLMKGSMQAGASIYSFAQQSPHSLILFLLTGFVITLLVQSSSVNMAITLSALSTGSIGFVPAAAIVLGSETGTTIKTLFTGIGGNASKKRVVLGNFIFNIVTTVLVFIFIHPILNFITSMMGITDPLIGLVTFSTIVNLLGLMVFLPLLNPFSKLLEKFFKREERGLSIYLGHANIKEPHTALDLLHQEVNLFIKKCMTFNLEIIGRSTDDDDQMPLNLHTDEKYTTLSHAEKYDHLKQLHGEIQQFYIKLDKQISESTMNATLNQAIAAVRSAMYSSKSIKDITSNIANLLQSSHAIKYNFIQHHKREIITLYSELVLLLKKGEESHYAQLVNLYNDIENNYLHSLKDFYKEVAITNINDTDISIVLNFNRELFTSNKAMLMAVKDHSLNNSEAGIFNDVPVYKS